MATVVGVAAAAIAIAPAARAKDARKPTPRAATPPPGHRARVRRRPEDAPLAVVIHLTAIVSKATQTNRTARRTREDRANIVETS